jgi:CBS domain-containing protein
MGELKVEKLTGSLDKAHYIKHLLSDIEALETMLNKGMFANDVIRIGAEQEFCLVDRNWEPSNKAMAVLKAIDDDHFTTEIALYNLEANLDPLAFSGTCFSELHSQLKELLAKASAKANKEGLKIILTGILPTIDSRHLKIDYMSPIKRYEVLNSIICDLRGDDLYLHIKGVDELNLRHDSILLEGCNTSFQGHLQLEAEDFADSYNWAQAIAGPVLSVCANSPVLIGRELWQESRIALFTQSVDTRASAYLPNEYDARVGFGKDWVQGTIVDFYRDSVVNFSSLITTELTANSLHELERGIIPKLKALQLHNGTVYKWNRLCYGITAQKPHVRIENRYLPAGPTTDDEIANFMFWAGLMRGRTKAYENVHKKMDFRDVKSNFYNAARYGSAVQFYWRGKMIPYKELLLDELLPMAHKGLYAMKVVPKDVEHYLGIIENRIKGRNGARWMVESLRALKKEHKTPEALRILTASMHENERKGYTIDEWQLASRHEYETEEIEKTVRLFMNTKVITAEENDSAALVLKMMEWKNIHHLPIVNDQTELTGLLTWTDVQNYADDSVRLQSCASDLMRTELITVSEDTTLREAKEIMNTNKINCLPVLAGKTLRGIITAKDL